MNATTGDRPLTAAWRANGRRSSSTVIELVEYNPVELSLSALPQAVGERLWQRYGRYVDVEFPSPRSGGRWRLTAQDWIGLLPLEPYLRLVLRPKVPLPNLFWMLAYAYDFKAFHLLETLADCRTLEAFYGGLAAVLARRVLLRARQGFYRAYLPQESRLSVLRGRLDVAAASAKPWDVALPCRYQEHTADVPDNQILVWTLARLLGGNLWVEGRATGKKGDSSGEGAGPVISEGRATGEGVSRSVEGIGPVALPLLRRAFRALRPLVTLVPFGPADCAGRSYNRLNDDYRLLHVLCRLFLEHSGPGGEPGDDRTLPFLLNVERLFELFVARWLGAHLPSHLGLRTQERVQVDPAGGFHFDVDLVLYDRNSGAAVVVLDTKYKTSASPVAADVAQVVTYATAKACRDAVLIYPTPLDHPLDITVGPVRVRSLSFSLDGDLEAAGRAILKELG